MLVACLIFVLTRMPETLDLTPKEVALDVRAMWGSAGDWQELEMHEMDKDIELTVDQFESYQKRSVGRRSGHHP